MIARFHYDSATLDRLRLDELRDDETDVLQHVETCEECQRQLETLSTEGMSWDEVRGLLQEPALDLAPGHSAVGEEEVSADSAAFLERSEHPGSLGRFARYEIINFLGRGGMGIVMRGYDTALRRHCAVKVLAPELANSSAARKRFSREARSAAAVVHPHVVPIQTVDEYNGLPYLVMPVVEGRSLQQRVEDSGPLSVIETIRISAQVAEGLAAAHEQGLVHRDIKPANILLENGVERVQITDFGLARAVDDASMTRSGVIAGTPQYMSPEQAHGDTIDHRSDLFSLGSVMYFMLTGRSPFRAETTMGVLNRIGNDAPRSLRSINADVPDWLESIVMTLLEKQPEARFQSAEEVAGVLRRRHADLQQPGVASVADFVHPSESAKRTRQPDPIPALRPDRPLPEGRGGKRRVGRWLAAAAFACFAFAGALIYLETRLGTLRIESNADGNVPLVIRRDGKIVRELTVSQEGATARLRAGEYSIEAEVNEASILLLGKQVTIQAGGEWVARIELQSEPTVGNDSERRDPSVVRQEAIKDAKQGHYQASLEKILWCWEHGLRSQPSWSGVRRSFLLADWLDLADSYPAAREKLSSIRDDLQQRVLSKNQLRVSVDDFADLTSLYRVMREEHRSIEDYERLDPQDQKRVYFFLPYCPSIKKPTLHDCKQCHQAYPNIDLSDDKQSKAPPKLSPFTRMEFDEDRVIVTFRSEKYELLGIDHLSVVQLVEQTRNRYDALWKKRLSEDLVEVLWNLGHIPGQTVDLRLRSIETGAETNVKEARLSKENRSRLYRDNEHNQPRF
jgi:hypothetical protein